MHVSHKSQFRLFFSDVAPPEKNVRSGVKGRSGVTRSGSALVPVSAGADSHETDVVVIGSGVGGLSAAAMLSRHGDSVTVLESHYLPGGVAHAFDIEGYRFAGRLLPRVPAVGRVASIRCKEVGSVWWRFLCGVGVGDATLSFHGGCMLASRAELCPTAVSTELRPRMTNVQSRLPLALRLCALGPQDHL